MLSDTYHNAVIENNSSSNVVEFKFGTGGDTRSVICVYIIQGQPEICVKAHAPQSILKFREECWCFFFLYPTIPDIGQQQNKYFHHYLSFFTYSLIKNIEITSIWA